jgi:hypothetical protein
MRVLFVRVTLRGMPCAGGAIEPVNFDLVGARAGARVFATVGAVGVWCRELLEGVRTRLRGNPLQDIEEVDMVGAGLPCT